MEKELNQQRCEGEIFIQSQLTVGIQCLASDRSTDSGIVAQDPIHVQ